MRFEIIIPTYQNREELRACLLALQAQTFREFRVWVCVDDELLPSLEGPGVGNWPNQDLAQVGCNFPIQFLTHPDGRNHGAGPARNLALPYLEYPYTLFLDSDIRPAPDWLARWAEVAPEVTPPEGGARGGAWLGQVIYTNARTDPWARYLSTRGRAKFAPGAAMPPLYFNTQNALVRSADLQAVGGFDEHLPGYGGDDTDLGHRLGRLPGFTLRYHPTATGYTENDKPLPAALRQLEGLGANNLRYLYAKDPSLSQFYKVGWMAGHGAGAWLLRVAYCPLWAAPLRWLALRLGRQCPTALLHYVAVGSVYRGSGRKKEYVTTRF